jgi:hypothetical protein
MDQVFGGFAQVPLDMATKAGAVIEDAQGLWGMPDALGIHHSSAAMVEVQVPETVHILRLEASYLS